MIVLHLHSDYNNSKWIDDWFKRDLCICRFQNFPVDKISRRSWVGIHMGDTIQFAGKLDIAKQILNSKTYRIYLKTLIGFKPIKYTIKDIIKQYDFINIDEFHFHGRHMMRIGDIKRVLPIFPKSRK